MDSNIKMRLCGGTFFVLLLEARASRRSSRIREGRPSDGKSNSEILKRLLYLVNTDIEISEQGNSFKTFTSDYKNCRTSDAQYINLTDEYLVNEFDTNIKTNYYEYLEFFDGLFRNALNWESKGPWLVAALIDLIENDDTIPSNALFYVRPYGHTVAKSELRNIECICIKSFILGVWHYIVANIKDNTVGVETLDYFFNATSGTRIERKFSSNIGRDTISKINTSVQPPECEWDNFDNSELIETTKDIPFAFIQPGIAVDARNIVDGQIYVDGKQVFYSDGKEFDEEQLKRRTPFDTYLDKSIKFYSKIKTLLYANAPHDFNEFYVPNDTVPVDLPFNSSEPIIPIEERILHHNRKLIIQGTGGIGKSMMIRHLFLFFSEHFSEYNLFPIFVSLKNYNDQITSFENFIFNYIQDFDKEFQFSLFEDLLISGNCLILFDGLDEIPLALRDIFDAKLNSFIKSYQDVGIIVSSRPTSTFIEFNNFSVFTIKPFDKSKSIELIEKLDYYDLEAKNSFLKDLDETLFDSHKQFASNPLLLTIMLMTYTSYGEVPAKRHIFYAKAYETMARLHDATKGTYIRPMHTNLSPENFATYFAEFCARTYKAEIFEFDTRTFAEYTKKVILHQSIENNSSPQDYLLDLTNNLCIMYEEGEKYHFIHRSFQEYFCALFFSTQMDAQLERIADFFENQKRRSYGDITFDMLYDMIPNRIDRYIFLPYFDRLWQKCDSNNNYWTFLAILYPTIFIVKGTPPESFENDSSSFLYNFTVNETLHRHNGELFDLNWPDEINNCKHKDYYTEYDLKTGTESDLKTVTFEEISTPNSAKQKLARDYIRIEVYGQVWQIDILNILNNKEYYKNLISFIENDTFPLKKEYNEMRIYTNKLHDNFNTKSNSDDWFDAF